MKKPDIYKFLILVLFFMLALFFGIAKGSAQISLFDLLLSQNRQILELRVSRVMLALLTGAGLGVCGVVLQAILRNPLAEPYLLGTSSAACLGAVLAMVAGFPSSLYPLAAFITAISAMILVYLFAREGLRISVQALVLCGVIVSVAISGIIVFLITLYPDKAIHGVMWWLWGDLQVYDSSLLVITAAVVILCLSLIFFLYRDLNAISLGEDEAIHLGIDIEKMKKILFVLTSLITATLVSVAGIIGFVGLIMPHLLRLVVGANHKKLIPAVCLGSAAFLVFCDTLSRSLFRPIEIPIGVVTSLVGAPLFIILLKQKQKAR